MWDGRLNCGSSDHLTDRAGSVGDFAQMTVSWSGGAATPKPMPSPLEQLLQWLLTGAQAPKPALPAKTASSDIESLLQILLPGTLASAARTQPGPMRRDWATVVCFSCGKAGHGATWCPDLNKAFPFMLPG